MGLSTAVVLVAGCFAGAPGADALGVPAGAGPLPPHLSLAHAKYYDSHPAEWDALLKRLPRLTMLPLPRHQQQPPPVGNTWTGLTNSPPEGGLNNPLLLTDGTVIVHVGCSEHWYKLKPDAFGSYVNGSWSAIASFPSGYSPLYFASQILNNGRVVANGGEYNNNGDCTAVWQTNGAIYDPILNTWTPLAPPSGWTSIGDAQSVILPNTRYMLANCCTTEAAILDSGTLTWTPTGSGKFDVNDEEGWALLHDGSVLTTDAYVFTGTCGTGSERYKAGTGSWNSAGNATTQLSDCSGNNSYEVGPIVVRASGIAVAFSGVTTGVAGTSIYHPSTGLWSAGPNLPIISGQNYNLADAPAVELPNNSVLFAASPGLFGSPVHFFDLTPANAIVQLPDTPNAPGLTSYLVNFLMLPTGQVLQTDGSNDVEIYTPDGTYNSAWKPVISSVPTTLTRGSAYTVSGTQLNGITHGVYGDDQQAATNFPLVRLTNNTTQRVRFARTRYFSSRSDGLGHASRANFVVPGPSAIPAGGYTLVVIADGIPSDPILVTVN